MIPLYIMLIPGILYFIIYRYLPMSGLIMAFQDFNLSKGFFRSEWVGVENFQKFFASPFFSIVVGNTVKISLLKLLVGFPMPIILSLMLNEVRNRPFKRTVQTVIYLPHFLSWVIIGNLIYIFFGSADGVVTTFCQQVFGTSPDVLSSPTAFPWVLILSDIWKELGWDTIIYMATLTSVSPEWYEAAQIDGANKFQQILHITLPAILPTIITMFILRIGTVMNAGFEQILILQNDAVYQVSEVIDTYSYQRGFLKGQYGFGAAIGLFQSVIGMILVIITNKLTRKTEGGGIW